MKVVRELIAAVEPSSPRERDVWQLPTDCLLPRIASGEDSLPAGLIGVAVRFRVSQQGSVEKAELRYPAKFPEFEKSIVHAIGLCRFPAPTEHALQPDKPYVIRLYFKAGQEAPRVRLAEPRMATCPKLSPPPDMQRPAEDVRTYMLVTVTASGGVEKAVIEKPSAFPQWDSMVLEAMSRCEVAPAIDVYGNQIFESFFLEYRLPVD